MQHVCGKCSKVYSRSDALRRHMKACYSDQTENRSDNDYNASSRDQSTSENNETGKYDDDDDEKVDGEVDASDGDDNEEGSDSQEMEEEESKQDVSEDDVMSDEQQEEEEDFPTKAEKQAWLFIILLTQERYNMPIKSMMEDTRKYDEFLDLLSKVANNIITKVDLIKSGVLYTKIKEEQRHLLRERGYLKEEARRRAWKNRHYLVDKLVRECISEMS